MLKEEINELRDDCLIMLNRALLNKTVAAFGIDGQGDHGQSMFAQYFTINDITVLMAGSVTGDLWAITMLTLGGYDSWVTGHVATDKNLTISINKLLTEQHIDSTCWKYDDIKFQGADFAVIRIDVARLLDWP